MAPTTPSYAEHDCDDGLDHGHGWSSNDPVGGAPHRAHRPSAPGHDHDDGLVHDHGWARG